MRLIDRGLQAILPENDSAGAAFAWMAGAVAAAVGLGIMVKGANGREVELSRVPALRLDRPNASRLLAAWRGDMKLSGEIERGLELSEDGRAVLADALLERGDPIGPALALELQRAPYVLIEEGASYDDVLRCECRNVVWDRKLGDDSGTTLEDLATTVLASGTLAANEEASVRTAVESYLHRRQATGALRFTRFYRPTGDDRSWGWFDWMSAVLEIRTSAPPNDAPEE